MVYVEKSAEDISAREMDRAKELSKEYDDYNAQEGFDPFADEEAFGAFGLWENIVLSHVISKQQYTKGKIIQKYGLWLL